MIIPMDAPLKTRINADLKEAMRNSATTHKLVLRLLSSMIKNEEIEARVDARAGVLSEADVLALVRREIKQHEESLTEAKDNNRPDLIEEQMAELAILRAYLPRQLSRDEIAALVRGTIGELGIAAGKSAHGQVMKAIQPKVKDIADGKLVNEVVRELLGA